MPQINRIRVNNVKYNFGTQFYDDFVMRFSGKNTIYDLANGGGKSVLMLLLLQNLIPNCTLDDKQPIEKLFRTGSGSNTIHSLIEWKLDAENIRNNYKYMLTGFCARKAKDEEAQTTQENAAIEYFNYCIFYREFNENDLKNLPLTNGRERITYNGLKNYLRELERKDFSLEVKIFERKGEYQRFIAQYGLYESQWEIIRGINRTEGHVRTYFESNYKTTRKVVEDLLIEEIIEKSFKTRVAVDGDGGESMARTLLDIKDKLIELAKKKDDINNYDRQIEAIESFAGRISGIRQLYFGREELDLHIKKCYNTLNKIIKQREEKLLEYRQEMEKLSKRKRELEKDIDTIRVCKDEVSMSEITASIDELTKSMLNYREEYQKGTDELLIMESENDYMDYLYYKSERDSVREVIENMSKGDIDREKAIEELQALAKRKKALNEEKADLIRTEIEKEEAFLNREEELLNEKKETEARCIKEISVAKYLVEDFEEKLKALSKEIYREKEALGIIMNPNIEDELKKLTRKKWELESNLEKASRGLVDAVSKNKEQEYKQEAIRLRIADAESLINELLEIRQSDKGLSEKLEKLMELYAERNINILSHKVSEKYKEIIGEVKHINEQLEQLNIYAKNLEKGCPVGKSNEVEKILEYIEKYHGDIAISGSDYMAGLSPEEKQLAIAAVPMLPYSIVIKSSFNTISSDTKLKNLLTGDYAVALIKADAIRNAGYLFDVSNVTYVMKDEALFTDEEAINKELEKTVEKIKDLEIRLEKLIELEAVTKSEDDFIKEYIDIHRDRMSKNEKDYSEKRLLVKELESNLEEAERIKLEQVKYIEDYKNQDKALKKEISALEEKIKILEDIVSMDKESTELEQKISNLKQKNEELKKQYNNAVAGIKAANDSATYRREAIDAMKKELAVIEDNWNSLYRQYYSEAAGAKAEYDKLTNEELDVKAKALKEMIAGAVKDINDKQRLMENYDIAMEKSLQAIDYKGIDISVIKNRYDSGRIKRHSKEELASYKKLLLGVKDSISSIESKLVNDRASRDKLEGAIMHAIAAIEEKYGSYEKWDNGANTKNPDRVLEESRESINAILVALDEISSKAAQIEGASKDYIIYKRDVDKIVENAGITITDEEECYEDGVDFTERLKNVSDRYEKYKKDVLERREELEYEKSVLADTLKALSSYQLADEIRNEVKMPQSVSETVELIRNLEEIISCIGLEKERVEKNIADMERIKENFENQCIQSCVNIKTELERLPKLSKIYMDGEQISIIGLNIPFIKEEQYKEEMANYIEELVMGADRLKDEDERVKYIKNQLSWKKLFSVIVTDMNAIRLTLYKRERIKEQSRYLRYEEAVGSTGQSQGIYIQFLVAIINYITAINSGNTENRSLGKVVFIDNPFGAAKDIYIWEPIFKLLKTNNVQLIVPCRGATPAITGRFDVNYILGQKMIDGKQQTVVVEYFSNVESDSVEYDRLSFEQNQLVFE